MNIAILAGGVSEERAVSLDSGRGVARALLARGHRVLLCDPVLALRFDVGAPLFTTEWTEPRATEPLCARFRFGSGVLDALRRADGVFLALHGGAGEDGTVQAALDALGISYTGSGAQACLLAQNKYLSKLLFEKSGIPTPRTLDPDAPSFPCIVKPRDGGSSVGISLCHDRTSLACALRAAGDTPVLVEEYLCGKEYSVGILDGVALPPVEIRPRGVFYDYESKYEVGGATELCPSPSLDAAASARLCDLALRAHRVLGLGSYSRIDFLGVGEDFVCLEANALPGMTKTSLLPLAAAAVGLTFGALCERIFAGRRGA